VKKPSKAEKNGKKNIKLKDLDARKDPKGGCRKAGGTQ
jgi:hypothetical protein